MNFDTSPERSIAIQAGKNQQFIDFFIVYACVRTLVLCVLLVHVLDLIMLIGSAGSTPFLKQALPETGIDNG